MTSTAGNMATPKPKILVVEDDHRQASLLKRHLEDQGYAVRVVHDAKRMFDVLDREPIDLVVLDVMLPGEDGHSACKRLKEMEGPISKTPVIMLTARGDMQSRLMGLDTANDFMSKPFDPRELILRINNCVKSAGPAAVPGAPSAEDKTVTFGDYELSLATRELTRGDEVYMLTTGEFAVLKALVMHARQPLTRDKLMNLARGREWDALERSIDVQISRLRRMIEPDPSKPRYIQTVWGVGYVFVPDGSASK